MPLQGDLQIRVGEVSTLEKDWSPVRGGAGVGQAVGEVELGRMAPALAVDLEGSHRPPGNGIADRHHRDPGRGQEGVVQILRDRDRETEDARDVDRCLETDMRAGLPTLAGLDAGEEGRRLWLIGQDGDDGGGVDEHRSARPHRVALGVAQRGSGRPIRLRQGLGPERGNAIDQGQGLVGALDLMLQGEFDGGGERGRAAPLHHHLGQGADLLVPDAEHDASPRPYRACIYALTETVHTRMVEMPASTPPFITEAGRDLPRSEAHAS